jgi:Kef-type K+ transport system membrane component KefB
MPLLLALLLPLSAAAAGDHQDPIGLVALYFAIILAAAKIGGDLVSRLGQPAVLGELLAGIVLGNLPLIGISGLEMMKVDPTIDMLARLGVLILLFEVGLESSVGQMMKVGLSSFLVAVVGVICPFALGWWVSSFLLPDHSGYVHAFIGATLTATSVGITARVLKDLNQSQTKEARIILGAAVIDDVLGLIILAVVGGLIAAANVGTTMSYGSVAMIFVKAVLFLGGSLAIGVFLSPKFFHLASRLRSRGVLLATGLGFCFLLSWLANKIGLASIVGAFAAGLILEDVHYKDFVARGEHRLEELVAPVSTLLAPVFFVLMGMHTDLSAFVQPGVFALAVSISFIAVAAKLVAGFGVVGRGTDRLSIGIGMIPRGEVGLIFANIGLALSVGSERIVSETTFSAVVVMVIVTTLVTPPALKWSLNRRR